MEEANEYLVLEATDDKRKRAETKALDVSLNELADMYEGGELYIRPEFQRLFRWSASSESQFIESLLLEMPVPPIYCMEVAESKWELIDGLQRISSYLHFRGMLTADHRGIKPDDYLVLENCDIVPELGGKVFNDLPAALQIRLKRAFLRVELIRSSTDSRFKYYMFKRLNTNGEPLSNQEIRNCTIRLLDDRFNSFIIGLSGSPEFKKCIATLSEDATLKMIDVELVLRFFAFKNNFDGFKHDVGPFLDEYMERVTDEGGSRPLPFDYAQEEARFNQVFGLLNACLAEGTCQKYIGGQPKGGFSNHQFEAFSLGLAEALSHEGWPDPDEEKLKLALLEAKGDAELATLTTGGGKNSPGPYRAKIEAVKKYLVGAM